MTNTTLVPMTTSVVVVVFNGGVTIVLVVVGGAVGGEVGGAVGREVGGAVGGEVGRAVGGEVGRAVGGEVGGAVGGEVGGGVGVGVMVTVGDGGEGEVTKVVGIDINVVFVGNSVVVIGDIIDVTLGINSDDAIANIMSDVVSGDVILDVGPGCVSEGWTEGIAMTTDEFVSFN